MKRAFLFIWVTTLVLCGLARAQQADHPVISELRYYETSGVNEEFAEIYNPTDTAVDLGGWKLQYKPREGGSYADKQVFPAGEILAAHGYLLFGGTALTVTPDYPSAVAPGFGNSGGHLRLVNASNVVIDLLGWGTADSPEGTAATAHARGGSFERKAFGTSTAATMAPGGADALEGNGWDAGNNSADFVIHDLMANTSPQNQSSPSEPFAPLVDGSGTAVITPELVDSPADVDITVTVTGGDYELATVELELPDGWEPVSVATSGAGFAGGVFSVDNGVLIVENAQVTEVDTGIFTMTGVSHPMATATYTFEVRTAVVDGTPTPILTSPVIQVIGDPIAIEELHVNGPDGLPLMLGQTVVVRGVVTADVQMGVAAYMQDTTGGIVCYSASFANAVDVGQEVTVLGTVTHFSGLTELTPADLMLINDPGPVEVVPTVVTCAQIAAQGASGEPYEALLVRMNGLTVEGTGTWAGNTNYNISDASGTGQMRISPACELVGAPIPSGTFDMISLCSQYDFSSPYHSGYQMMPRFNSDIINTVGPGISGGPYESQHTTSSVHLSWTTQNPGTTIAVWGSANGALIDSVSQEDFTTDHDFTVTGLSAGTPYWIRVGSSNETGSSMTGTSWISTVSANPGTIEVLFTRNAETEYALPGNEAHDNAENEIVGRINALIDAAETSIDCAVYSLNINSIATALINAHDRGVAVRFIYDADHSQPQVAQLQSAGITVIDNSFGQHPSSGIQHNKFIVFEAADDDPNNDKVWTGSVNLIDQPSDNGIHAKDNAILFTDQAIAKAYTLEFNEMWGSVGMTPNPATSRFGEFKTNNTPHYFLVGGTPVELWFSHGDNVSQRMVNYLATADQSVYFCIFSFTRNEIGYAMRDAHQAGVAVRGVFDTVGDEFSEWVLLQEAGADIFVDAGTGVLHHKYMIIDAEYADADPVVVAGSYNWSNSAEDSNDENTIVIHDALIANQYLQEFAARYHASGGQADFNDLAEPMARPTAMTISSLYPNPFNPTTTLELLLPEAGDLSLKVYDLAGRVVWSQDLGRRPAGLLRQRLDLSGQASGMYLLRAQSSNSVATRKMLLVR